MTTLTFTEKTPREMNICADFNYDADWYYNVTTIPGTYVARCTTLQGAPCSLEDAYWVLVSIDATVTGGYVPGYKGKNDATERIGEPMPYHFQTYGYSVRDSLKGEDSPYAIQTPANA